MDALKTAGTLDATAAAKLPAVSGTATFPTQAQSDKAQKVVTEGWSKAVAG
jgi:putative spermidine/putrescine transport system substrate-binding protein